MSDPRTWVGLAFLLFFIIFGKRIVSFVLATLDQRADVVRAELAEASRLKREAEAMLANATRRQAEAIADARRLLEGARTEAARLAEAAAEAARTSTARRERMALDRIAAAEKAAVDEVRLAAADIAAKAAEQVIRSGLSADADSRLVDRAITSLPQALRAA